MSAESFKDLNKRDLKLWLFFVSIVDKQQIFWKKSSRIFITLLFLLKFSRVFQIISYSFADYHSSFDLHFMIWQRLFNCKISSFISFEQQSFETFFMLWLSRKKNYISSKTSSQPRAILYSCLYQSKRNTCFFSKPEKR